MSALGGIDSGGILVNPTMVKSVPNFFQSHLSEIFHFWNPTWQVGLSNTGYSSFDLLENFRHVETLLKRGIKPVNRQRVRLLIANFHTNNKNIYRKNKTISRGSKQTNMFLFSKTGSDKHNKKGESVKATAAK